MGAQITHCFGPQIWALQSECRLSSELSLVRFGGLARHQDGSRRNTDSTGSGILERIGRIDLGDRRELACSQVGNLTALMDHRKARALVPKPTQSKH